MLSINENNLKNQRKMLLNPKIKTLIEPEPIAISTIMKTGTPNVIGAACIKVVNNLLIVTDNFMNQTIEDIQHNPRVAIVI